MLHPTEKSDVYSLAFIMWYIMQEQMPFDGLDLNCVKKYIIEDKSRPKIGEDVDPSIAH